MQRDGNEMIEGTALLLNCFSASNRWSDGRAGPLLPWPCGNAKPFCNAGRGLLQRANPHATAPSANVTIADPRIAKPEAYAAPWLTVCRITPSGNTNEPATSAVAIHTFERSPNDTPSKAAPRTINSIANPIQCECRST